MRTGFSGVAIFPYAKLAMLAAIATAVAYQIGLWWPVQIAAVPAAITAVLTTQATASRAFRMGFLQVVGVVFGAASALLFAHFFGYGPFTIAAMVLVCYAIVLVMKQVRGLSAPDVAVNIAVTVIIVLGSHLTTDATFERFTGVVVGAIIGLIASLFAVNKSTTDIIAQEVDDLYAAVATLVGDMGSDLRDANTSSANEWVKRAQDVRTRWRTVLTELEELETSAVWSPLIRRRDTSHLRLRMTALGMTLTRLTAIASDLKVTERRDLFTDSPEVLSPLASLLEHVAVGLDPEEDAVPRSRVKHHTRRAVETVSDSDMNTEEILMISALAQNASRLLPANDTALQSSPVDQPNE